MADWFDQFDQELRLWHREAGREYRESNAAIAALGDTFDNWDADFVFQRFTVDDEPALFVAVDKTTALVIQLESEGATVQFLGDITRGIYAETTSYQPNEVVVVGTYRHERIPGGNVSTARRVRGHGPTPAGSSKSGSRAEVLQALFREWAEMPQPAVS